METIINVNKIAYINCYNSYKIDGYSGEICFYDIKKPEGFYRKAYITIFFSDKIEKCLYFDSDDEMKEFNLAILSKMKNSIYK
jgi:hypothetical protein